MPDRGHAERFVEAFLDDRLRTVPEPPGVRDAVVARLFAQLESVQDRCREQIRGLRSPSSRRIPDAYFYDEEVLEHALQNALAGLRTARAVVGLLSPDALAEEELYASALAPTARWATLAEASRVPRPSTRHHALSSTIAPIDWQESDERWPPRAAIELSGARQLIGSDPVRVTEPPYENWVQLGLLERQRTFAAQYPKKPSREVVISCGVEVVSDSAASRGSLPFAVHPPHLWHMPWNELVPAFSNEAVKVSMERFHGPLAATVHYTSAEGAPAHNRGAGLHPAVLSPRIEVVAYLGLRPERPTVRHHLIDDYGPAIVCRVWHGFLIHDGNYTPLEPAIFGADLIIRPDLYERLAGVCGSRRLRTGVKISHYEGTNNDMDE